MSSGVAVKKKDLHPEDRLYLSMQRIERLLKQEIRRTMLVESYLKEMTKEAPKHSNE